MKYHYILWVFLISACNESKQASYKKNQIIQRKNEKEKNPREIWGNRLSVTGDFNGDGQKDTLTESFISAIDNKETNKYYEGLEYDSAVALTVRKVPFCKLADKAKRVKDLEWRAGPLFGLAYLKNEGDLDTNGTDEIGVVIDWADFSNLNSYKVYTYTDDKWITILQFDIMESDLETDATGNYSNSDFKGFILKNKEGQLVARTFENAETVEKVVYLESKSKH